MAKRRKRIEDDGEDDFPMDLLRCGRSRSACAMRGYRYRDDMTQAMLGRQLGVSTSQISLYENDKRVIDIQMAYRLGEIFGTSYKMFLLED